MREVTGRYLIRWLIGAGLYTLLAAGLIAGALRKMGILL